MQDFTAITEVPGSHLNQEQLARITQRYGLGATLAHNKDVLEVACGAGIGLGVLRQAARSLVGFDYTLPMLELARNHYAQRVPLVCADAQRLPFVNRAFDLVLSFEAIYYLQRLDWFLDECRRVLRSEGTLLIGTSNPDWPHFAAGQMSVDYPDLPTLAAQIQAKGFQLAQFYGALPIEQGASRQTLFAALRKRLLQHKFFTQDSALTRRLKQLAYGRLTPLPAELSPSALPSDVYRGLTLLATSAPDRVHRVLFSVARKA